MVEGVGGRRRGGHGTCGTTGRRQYPQATAVGGEAEGGGPCLVVAAGEGAFELCSPCAHSRAHGFSPGSGRLLSSSNRTPDAWIGVLKDSMVGARSDRAAHAPAQPHGKAGQQVKGRIQSRCNDKGISVGFRAAFSSSGPPRLFLPLSLALLAQPQERAAVRAHTQAKLALIAPPLFTFQSSSLQRVACVKCRIDVLGVLRPSQRQSRGRGKRREQAEKASDPWLVR